MTDLPLWATMGRARRNGHATSQAAGDSLPCTTPAHQLLLRQYELAGSDGLTDEEAAQLADLPATSCWWKRCGELRKAGAIVPAGRTRAGAAGRARIVCVAAQARPVGAL